MQETDTMLDTLVNFMDMAVNFCIGGYEYLSIVTLSFTSNNTNSKNSIIIIIIIIIIIM